MFNNTRMSVPEAVDVAIGALVTASGDNGLSNQQKKNSHPVGTYETADDLIDAMVTPIDSVLTAVFQLERNIRDKGYKKNNDDNKNNRNGGNHHDMETSTTTITNNSNSSRDCGTVFAELISKKWNDPWGPSKRYLRTLVRRYVHLVDSDEGRDNEIMDETLLDLIVQCSLVSDTIPDPTECGYQSFNIPYYDFDYSTTTRTTDDTDPTAIGDDKTITTQHNNHHQQCNNNHQHHHRRIRLLVYPQHNDISLRLWEAGGALAEYLLYRHPEWIHDKVILETGAGVGLTGLVLAPLCQHYHMTDHTLSCIQNLSHNIEVNYHDEENIDNQNQQQNPHHQNEWGYEREEQAAARRGTRNITCGFLDWDWYSSTTTLKSVNNSPLAEENNKSGEVDPKTAQFFHVTADILLAADVVYDRNNIGGVPSLVQMVHQFLSCPREQQQEENEYHHRDRKAIFATTVRNQETFHLFEAALKELNIQCEYQQDMQDDDEDLPYLFPIYNIQPRTDVRICIMTLPSS